MQLIDNLPLWVFFLTVLIVSTLSLECGHRIADWRLKVSGREAQAPLATILAAILSLLAFMLAFTFNVALGRYDDRRVAVLTEANDIGTTYQRADFFDNPQKDEIKKLLREYVQLRYQGIVFGTKINQVVVKSEELQDKLWTIGASLAKAHQNSPIYALFISSLNEVIDIHAKRVHLGFQARVPTFVWIILLSISFLAMMAVGFYCSMAGNRGRAETLILVSVFALVMLLVADLDRPFDGLVKTNQQPMIDLYKKLGPP
jgi:hypothetical protein